MGGVALTSGEIDLGTWGDKDMAVQAQGDFKAEDILTLHWEGKTQQGQSLPLTLEPDSPAVHGNPVKFTVPYADLAKLGQGSARAFFTITRGERQAESKTLFLNVKGMAVELPAAMLDKAEDDWVDADLAQVHVLVPATCALLEEDEVIIHWRGTTSNGTALFKTSKMFRVTKNQVGKRLPIRLRGADFLKPFDGGFVDISYQVTRGTRVLTSEHTTYQLGYLAETLPAPTTDPLLSNSLLDPELDTYEHGVEIVIPQLAQLPTPCTVTLYWSTSEGVYYEDEQKLEAGDEVSAFLVPSEQLKIKGDKPVDVEVYYIAEWDDKPSQASADLWFRLGTQGMLEAQAPSVELFDHPVKLAELHGTVEFPAVHVTVTGPAVVSRAFGAQSPAQTAGGLVVAANYSFQKNPGLRMSLKKPSQKVVLRCDGGGVVTAFGSAGEQIARHQLVPTSGWTDISFDAGAGKLISSIEVKQQHTAQSNFVYIGKLTFTY
ncbi:hypothetical protein [Pseudomonas putida]